jgi:aminotransferase
MKKLPKSSISVVFEKARRTHGVNRLEVGEPDMITPEHIRRAAQTAIDAGFTHYTPISGFEELREAIAEKVRFENGIDADFQNEVVVTLGASSALYCAILALVNPGEEVFVPNPGWTQYIPHIQMAGGIPIPYPQLMDGRFQIDLDFLARNITRNTKAILINSPNNPTGSVLRRDELSTIARIAQEKNIIVISDEVYEKIVYDKAEHVSIASLPNMFQRAVTVNSFSKTYAMTGWRIGYAIAPAEITAEMAKNVLYTGTCANSIGQQAAIAALTGSQDFVVNAVKEYQRRRDFVVKRLNDMEGVTCELPQGAFYAFPNIRELGLSSLDCADFLLDKAKVSTVPGSGFGSLGEGYLRLSYATAYNQLVTAMDQIEVAIKSAKSGRC